MDLDKCLEIVANACSRVVRGMARTETAHISIKKDERLGSEFAVAQVIQYEDMKNKVRGHFVLGFKDVAMAVTIASAVAETLELEPIEELNEEAEDILNEFTNTIVGHVITEWDKMGFPVRFEPPVSLRDSHIKPYESPHTESHLIILALGVDHLIFQITFTEARGEQHAGKRILVVDDSPVIRKLLTRALEGAGFEVVLAQNGLEAVEKFGEVRPHVTIMDLIMPEMGGLDATLEIQKVDPKAKIIILTSSARQDEIVTADTIGVAEYLIKPVKPPRLLKSVFKVLG